VYDCGPFVATALLNANPKMSSRDTVALLKENGIKRSKDWVNKRRFEALQANGGNPDFKS
jgi:hypothetical protein